MNSCLRSLAADYLYLSNFYYAPKIVLAYTMLTNNQF